GAALRYNFYDDNTTATASDGENKPDEAAIPGIFVQDEIKFSKKQTLLAGLRYDYDKRHGSILTPRLAYKWSVTDNDILRLNAGTGFRVVNLVTEDHAALTGARDVIIEEELDPEQSYNVNINYLKKIYTGNDNFIIVQDQGPGIPEELQKSLFQPFQRGEYAKNINPQGCGLGLSVVKAIMCAHGGDVSYSLTPENGSLFKLSWPV
ncbi:TonB-dependent receptor, partial [Halomonas sp. EGI 63088]